MVICIPRARGMVICTPRARGIPIGASLEPSGPSGDFYPARPRPCIYTPRCRGIYGTMVIYIPRARGRT